MNSITIADLINDGGTDNVGDGKLDLRGLSGNILFKTGGDPETLAPAGFSMNAGDTILVDTGFQIFAPGAGAITLGSIDNTASSVGMNLTSGSSITFNGDSKIIGLIADAQNGIIVNANLNIPFLGTILDADSGNDGIGTFTLNAGKTLTIDDSESFINGGDVDISGLIDFNVFLHINNTLGLIQLGTNNAAAKMNISSAELNFITAVALQVESFGGIMVSGVAAGDSDGFDYI